MSILTEINNEINDSLTEGVNLVQQGKAAFAIQVNGTDSFHIKFASAMKQLEIRVISVDDGVDLTHPNVYRHVNTALNTYFNDFPPSYYNKITMISVSDNIRPDTMSRILAPILQKSGTKWTKGETKDQNSVTFIRQN